MERLLKVMIEIETRFGEVEDNSLGRRYEDGLNAIRSGNENHEFLAATRLEQWIRGR